ncbi:hypothetical protein Pla123a_26900 [Posidoniimonas polymericola]|uniref:Uncharacterized protein n=1 Tax=Posidoniimonas polymericola TaxID=2528002 RepID=A0A5C5YM29_9BACT|nr:hypothetical protein [Posidoniimonas polymericola]TWT75906.1 hypothetical protein Pla123a_26900 [Posidoniimonas polymericola]
MPDPKPNFRVRLRTMLITLVVGGAAFGLSGRLLQRNPQLLIGLLWGGAVLGPLVAGIVTVVWLGVKERRRNLLIWGVLLAVTPLVGMFAASALQSMARGPGGIGMLSNTQLIRNELPKRWDEPWVWQELERRQQAGKLTAAESNDAIQTLALAMAAAHPNGYGSPLHWARQFLEAVVQEGQLSDKSLLALADAFYGAEPKLEPLARRRAGDGSLPVAVKFGSVWAENSAGVPLLVWRVKQVSVDGKPAKYREDWRRRDGWNGSLTEPLAAGEHELRIDVEAAYAPYDKMVGLNPEEVDPARAPQPLRRWQTSVTEKLTVYAEDEALVKLITDPRQLSGGHGVQVQRLVMQQTKDGGKLVLLIDTRGGSALNLGFSAAVHIDGQAYPLEGAVMRLHLDGSEMTGGNQLEAPIPVLITDARQADVVLTPNPAIVEQHPEVDAIWGKPITFTAVPLERLDLEESSSP